MANKTILFQSNKQSTSSCQLPSAIEEAPRHRFHSMFTSDNLINGPAIYKLYKLFAFLFEKCCLFCIRKTFTRYGIHSVCSALLAKRKTFTKNGDFFNHVPMGK